MTRRQTVIWQALWTAASATFLGLATENPNWLWNLPLGLIVGALVGWSLWPLIRQFQEWVERRQQHRKEILRERAGRRDGYITGDSEVRP